MLLSRRFRSAVVRFQEGEFLAAAVGRPREFLSQIVLGPQVQHLPVELREPFLDDLLEHLGEPVTVDYVRLNIDAVA